LLKIVLGYREFEEFSRINRVKGINKEGAIMGSKKKCFNIALFKSLLRVQRSKYFVRSEEN
jgi:hypothetical protein